ncbi:MAG TPA: hypothetical protein P5262_03755 [Candidatus Moranbacteria bacterium]|nr:hypothetical protein [Candidatus Moranbacteria bacterium]
MAYNIRQAKKGWMERQHKPLSLGGLLQIINSKPGTWKRILEYQKNAMFSKQEEDDAAGQ